MIEHPFEQGVTTSLSATAPIILFGLTGYHTLRGVYSTAEGLNFDDAPQFLLLPGSQTMLTKQGYYFGSYALQQFLWQDPDSPGRGWGFLVRSPSLTQIPTRSETPSSSALAARLPIAPTIVGASRGATTCSAATSSTDSPL